MISQCNAAWKKFKKKLRHFMDTGRNPRLKYTYLPLEDWERFIEMHDNEQVRVWLLIVVYKSNILF